MFDIFKLIPLEILILINLNKGYNRKSIGSKNFRHVKRSRKYHAFWDYFLSYWFSNKSFSI